MKIHEGAAILHPWSNRIKARSLSCRATVMRQRTTSYPLVAFRFMICHPQRTTWRLNRERGPCAIPAVLSVACIAEYEEKSAKSDNSQSRPSKMCPRGTGRSTITSVHVSYLRGCTRPTHAYIHHCPRT